MAIPLTRQIRIARPESAGQLSMACANGLFREDTVAAWPDAILTTAKTFENRIFDASDVMP